MQLIQKFTPNKNPFFIAEIEIWPHLGKLITADKQDDQSKIATSPSD